MATQLTKLIGGTALTWKAASGDADITLASLASTKARQSTKMDFGPAGVPWSMQYMLRATIESGAGAPAKGLAFNFYMGWSDSGTAGTNNPGGLSGADAAYKDSEEDEWTKQLDLIGSLISTNDATAKQVKDIGVFTPPMRYGILVVQNIWAVTIETNDDEHKIIAYPTDPQLQAAV